MHTTAATRKVAVLVLTALMIAAMVFAFASALTATDAEAGTRIGTSLGQREST
jgi:hypothetical protein